MIIDFHTHAFPDDLSGKAISTLEMMCDIKARLDGKISSLLNSMDKAGIDKAVICSIATRSSQFNSILEWSKKINSNRIIPFLSVHPEDKDIKEKLKIVFEEGFKGIKLHPYYQSFIFDEEKVFPIYENCEKYGLILIAHTGFDIAFPRDRISDPKKILNVCKKFDNLKLVTTHFGAWYDWDEVETHLLGKKIYMEISFSLELLEKEKARKFLMNHPSEYVLFGTDSPWTDQSEALELFNSLYLKNDIKENVLYKNAMKLLGI